MNVGFTPLHESPAGLIASMLSESYTSLLRELGEREAAGLHEDWLAFDKEVQHQPETVGACGFVTRVDGDAVGFASWDPRGWPEAGRVGHNCILPAHQGRGHGSRQIEEILRRLRARAFATARARTGEHPFFGPARRMYVRCGFRAVEHQHEPLAFGCGTVVYEIVLADEAV